MYVYIYMYMYFLFLLHASLLRVILHSFVLYLEIQCLEIGTPIISCYVINLIYIVCVLNASLCLSNVPR